MKRTWGHQLQTVVSSLLPGLHISVPLAPPVWELETNWTIQLYCWSCPTPKMKIFSWRYKHTYIWVWTVEPMVSWENSLYACGPTTYLFGYSACKLGARTKTPYCSAVHHTNHYVLQLLGEEWAVKSGRAGWAVQSEPTCKAYRVPPQSVCWLYSINEYSDKCQFSTSKGTFTYCGSI